MRCLIIAGLIALTSGSNCACAAFACSLLSQTPTIVQQGDRRYQLNIGLDNCEGVRIVSGAATACRIDAKNRTVCRPFEKGEVVSESRLAGNGSRLLAVLDMLKGDVNSANASSRALEPLGLPYGRVLMLQPSLRFDLADSGLGENAAIEFRGDAFNGPLISELTRHGAAYTQDVRLFRPDHRYFWIIRGASAGLAPRDFTVASSEELQRARKAFAEIERDRSAGAFGQVVMKAEWLKRQNYPFDAEETLRAAGLDVRR